MYAEFGIKVGESGTLCATVNAAGEAFLSFEDDHLETTYMADPGPAGHLAAQLRALADAIEQAAAITSKVEL